MISFYEICALSDEGCLLVICWSKFLRILKRVLHNSHLKASGSMCRRMCSSISYRLLNIRWQHSIWNCFWGWFWRKCSCNRVSVLHVLLQTTHFKLGLHCEIRSSISLSDLIFLFEVFFVPSLESVWCLRSWARRYLLSINGLSHKSHLNTLGLMWRRTWSSIL